MEVPHPAEVKDKKTYYNAIDKALEEADEGRFISSAAMNRWVDSWGGDTELPAPQVDSAR